MEEKKFTYWKDRINVSFNRLIRDMQPSIKDVTEFTTHVNKKSKANIEEKVKAVNESIKNLASAVEKALAKKGK